MAQQIAVLKEMTRDDPLNAAAILGRLAEAAPTAEQRLAARLAEGEARFAAGLYEPARVAYDRAATTAQDDSIRNEATFKAALADFVLCREIGHDVVRLRRAKLGLERFVKNVGGGVEADAAQLYLWVIENVMREQDVLCRPVYYAVSYLPEKRCKEAYPVLKKGARRFRGSRAGETARFFQGECLHLQKKNWKAFKVYDLFLEEYPATARLRHVVGREFAIGTAVKEDGESGKALIIFERVVAHAPSGPLADDALMQTGCLHLEDGRYDDARAAFDELIGGYAQSEWYYAAVFSGGKADLMESDYRSDNEEVLARARRSFEIYLKYRPKGTFAEEAEKHLETCRKELAVAQMEVARFYERQRKSLAAATIYRCLLQELPETSESQEAREKLRKYEKEGLRLP